MAFRLADGSVRRPYSLVTIKTPKFGSIGNYVLEGMQASILLSVREMRRRGMIIDFQSGRALVTNSPDSGQGLIELEVTTNSRGHMLLDFAATTEQLNQSTLEKMGNSHRHRPWLRIPLGFHRHLPC